MRAALLILTILLSPSFASAGDTLKLLSAESRSQTEIHLIFNYTVSLDPKKAPTAFLVVSEEQEILPLTRLILEGKTVTLLTAPQSSGAMYTVYVNTTVYGTSPQTAFLLDPNQNSASFQSIGTLPAAIAAQPRVVPPPLTATVLAKEMSSASGLSPQDLGMVIFVVVIGALAGWMSVRVFHKEI